MIPSSVTPCGCDSFPKRGEAKESALPFGGAQSLSLLSNATEKRQKGQLHLQKIRYVLYYIKKSEKRQSFSGYFIYPIEKICYNNFV
jgi:hypothetical protein